VHEVAIAVHPLEGQQTDANFSTAFDLHSVYLYMSGKTRKMSTTRRHTQKSSMMMRRTFAHAVSMANIRYMVLTMYISFMAANADTMAP
jgi:hypothetical protein